ncbi:MAG TPA: YggS family pyridoxal phosphate-dependent enzyme [Spirochaetota bacterium]|nr:YggS family pyridoxal phosphate-dependent enzyme [Spirochaetota bacterium]
MSIIDNYTAIEKEIAAIATASGRGPGGIRIVAVSKTFDESVIQEAIDSGIRVFGENKIQEARRKIPSLRGDFTFHMVGHLQSNKAREAVQLFDLIHSIDKADTAAAVDREAGRIGKKQKVLVQVNTSGEESKSGIVPASARDLVARVTDLKNLDLLGFMTMAPFTDDEGVIRQTFRASRGLMEEINVSLGLALAELSMGMSSDYRIAVEEGATLVRIGTAIFGHRNVE